MDHWNPPDTWIGRTGERFLQEGLGKAVAHERHWSRNKEARHLHPKKEPSHSALGGEHSWDSLILGRRDLNHQPLTPTPPKKPDGHY